MLISRTLKIIETHTAGNPTRHILAGLPRIPGNTMAEKMQYMHDHMDWVRRMTMMEPRGPFHISPAGRILQPAFRAGDDEAYCIQNPRQI